MGGPRPWQATGQGSGNPPARLRIRLAAEHRGQIVRMCLEALPLEACGLLLGRREGATAEVTEILPAANTRASPDRYEIAPEAVLAADRRARESGRLLLGAWHSHPGGPPVPSDTDRAEAWPDWCYLIVGLAESAQPKLRAWRLLGEDFVADTLEIE
jgi:desampylase